MFLVFDSATVVYTLRKCIYGKILEMHLRNKKKSYRTSLRMTYAECVLDAFKNTSLKTKGHFSILI